MQLELLPGSPDHLGARHKGVGTNFAVFSANATQIDLCIFSKDGTAQVSRQPLPERSGHTWHGFASGIGPGTIYGFRAHGSYAPEQGHRFNPNKLLMDPYTRELQGAWSSHPSTLGYQQHSANLDLSFDTVDNAPFVAKSVVSDSSLYQAVVDRPANDWENALIYETHVKGLTMQHKGVSEHLRGTYDGLATEPVLEHLNQLGVTAVELLPVHAFVDDGFLVDKGLRNYWGYNSIGFFAAEPRYFGANGLSGFKAMVQRLHTAGIEVLLDVVYNHTAEGDQRGQTLSYRGLDNASYYRLDSERPRYYVNDTGCGNTLNVSNPYVLRMVLDSLRFWVEQMGVDGFRFDLATTLARENHGFDRQGGFFDALCQDPVLSTVKLIAEPWDLGPGGYRVGAFPAPFAEWNDGYRDNVRRYWRGDHNSAQELSARLLGSSEQFDHSGRRAWSSVNFLAAHDGFTVADLTRYNDRHNEPNGEGGADGHSENLSDNCGVEGETTDSVVLERRAKRQRNMLATLFLSQGTPMLLSGDEIGNSQLGNNNAYCQDNSIGWIDWKNADAALLRFVRQLSQFRRHHKVMRQSRFLHGRSRALDGLPDVEWRSSSGAPLPWGDPAMSRFCLLLRCSAEAPLLAEDFTTVSDTVFLVFNRDDDDVAVTMPPAPTGQHWVRSIDTVIADFFPSLACEPSSVFVAGRTVVAFATTSSNGEADV